MTVRLSVGTKASAVAQFPNAMLLEGQCLVLWRHKSFAVHNKTPHGRTTAKRTQNLTVPRKEPVNNLDYRTGRWSRGKFEIEPVGLLLAEEL